MELNGMEVPEEYKKFIGIKSLKQLPDNLKRYKCNICHCAGFKESTCPDCGNEHNELMCVLDHTHCTHPISDGLAYCPICGQAMCPICGTHDVEQWSRITGYIQAIGGFNCAKQQEVKDRHRVNIATGKNDEVIPDKRV